MHLSIIIPTYNEKESICSLIESILQQTLQKISLEILVIDDASPDGTANLVINKHYPTVRVISRKEKGLVSAITTGIHHAHGSYIMWFDADLYMIPQYISHMYNKCISGNDLVIASRYIQNGMDTRHKFRAYSSLLINKFALSLLKLPFTDYTSGIIMCNGAKLKKMGFPSGKYGEYFIELLLRMHQQQWTSCEIGYICQDRIAGKSKATANILRFFYFGIHYVLKVISLRTHI